MTCPVCKRETCWHDCPQTKEPTMNTDASVIVPVEPTEAMCLAAAAEMERAFFTAIPKNAPYVAYKAMLAAAPAQAAPESFAAWFEQPHIQREWAGEHAEHVRRAWQAGRDSVRSSDGGLTAAEVEALESVERWTKDEYVGGDVADDAATICAALRRLSGAVSVDEGMVERAREAYIDHAERIATTINPIQYADRECLRAALTAALQAKAP